MRARPLLAAALAALIAGCGNGAASPTTQPGDAPVAGFRLETHGDTATALLQTAKIARQLCASIEAGAMAEQLQGVKEVRLSAYESGKPVICKVP